MEETEVMTNIDIRDFMIVAGTEDADYVVLSLEGGSSAKVAVGVLKKSISIGITPIIKEGIWWIGEENTYVEAAGYTPEFRKTNLGIEWKYTIESSAYWRLLISIEDIRIKYSDLDEKQREEISLKFSDLTEEDILELQKPAAETITLLEETNEAIMEEENARVLTEEQRVLAEAERSEAELQRKLSEQARNNAESARTQSEADRDASEMARAAAERNRVSAEKNRENNESERISMESSRNTAELERKRAESLRVEEENKRVKEFTLLKVESQMAVERANDTADHPTYIGGDNYVYKWDKASRTYNKTDIYVRGEAFTIRKVYSSISEMNADTSTSFREGEFCLINTGNVDDPENARLYVRNSMGSWDFMVDMSGAVGFTGKTAQFFIGAVSVGSGKGSASVTLSPLGTDEDGNPKYELGFVIPCLAYDDLSEAQIKELQRPASEMISILQSTEETISTAEAARQKAEEDRTSSESARAEAEVQRGQAELQRVESESIRVTAEQGRASSETERMLSEENRVTAEEQRVAAEQERASSENVRLTSERNRVSAEEQRASAESGRSSDEELRVEQESVRVAAEEMRNQNESGRVSAESDRVLSEAARKSDEETRKASESARVKTEDERLTAEQGRKEAELLRSQSEISRLQAEDRRVSAESLRETNESERSSNESARIASETQRDDNESVRIQNEEGRVSSEEARASAEQQRQRTEESRQEAETVREKAELDREEDYGMLRDEVVSATEQASKAALAARNLPTIIDGNWWLYDVESGRYVDTGFATGADYQLTKEKIENVFTGDISSHTHSNLFYRAQVYEEQPDFSTLSQWTGEDGSVHDYLPGNDIYVSDEAEPTGYANYRLAVTSAGNAWIRIPQISEGWQIVMVRKQ